MSQGLLTTEGTSHVKMLSRETNHCHWRMCTWGVPFMGFTHFCLKKAYFLEQFYVCRKIENILQRVS